MSIEAPEDRDNGQLLAAARIFLLAATTKDANHEMADPELVFCIAEELRRLIRNTTQQHNMLHCDYAKPESKRAMLKELTGIALLILHMNNEGHYAVR